MVFCKSRSEGGVETRRAWPRQASQDHGLIHFSRDERAETWSGRRGWKLYGRAVEVCNVERKYKMKRTTGRE
jgi:hypothetical protein